jgi:hypothetical protein
MSRVTVLTGANLDLRKLERRLARARCATTRTVGGLRVTCVGDSSAVDASLVAGKALPYQMIKGASELIGMPPTTGLTCAFAGPVGESEAWATVIEIAKAAATVAPLAVLDDHAGGLYLVNPNEGLISATELQPARSTTPTNALLRRLLGDDGR